MAKDLFSKQAAEYAKWRPGYPSDFIEYIISFTRDRDAAWDCATGNGQAATLLAEHFQHVFATDLSSEQLKHARQLSNITYSQSAAEQTGFAPATFDLVTVAQAYHWFDQPAFCVEARRVCKPGGLVAIWGYDLCKAADNNISDRIYEFYRDVTGPYWDSARTQIDHHYRDVYFDFTEVPVEKQFSIRTHWTISDLGGYLNSWSAIQKYITVNGSNPVDIFIEELREHWKKDIIEFEFPLFLRMGTV